LHFNWRGRTSACTQTFALQNSRGEQSWVDVSDAGDVTVDSTVDITTTTASYASVNANSGVQSQQLLLVAMFTTTLWIAMAYPPTTDLPYPVADQAVLTQRVLLHFQSKRMAVVRQP